MVIAIKSECVIGIAGIGTMDIKWLQLQVDTFLGPARPLDTSGLTKYGASRSGKFLCVQLVGNKLSLDGIIRGCFQASITNSLFSFQNHKPSDNPDMLLADAPKARGLLYATGGQLPKLSNNVREAFRNRHWDGPDPIKVVRKFYQTVTKQVVTF
jgi:hypothetical protein